MRSTAVALMLVVFVQANAGCSFIYVKGPQPEVQPPPPCTTDNGFPVADTVVAAVAVAALVAGVVVAAEGAAQSCESWGCIGAGAEVVYGGGAVIVGAVTTAIFLPSAITGYNRTADWCPCPP